MTWLSSLFGGKAPWKSFTFWGVILISGLPAALSQFLGIHLDSDALRGMLAPELSPGDRIGLILSILGIRRATTPTLPR
jgi:hypothetical protein